MKESNREGYEWFQWQGSVHRCPLGQLHLQDWQRGRRMYREWRVLWWLVDMEFMEEEKEESTLSLCLSGDSISSSDTIKKTFLCDITEGNQMIKVARGGEGGEGNKLIYNRIKRRGGRSRRMSDEEEEFSFDVCMITNNSFVHSPKFIIEMGRRVSIVLCLSSWSFSPPLVSLAIQMLASPRSWVVWLALSPRLLRTLSRLFDLSLVWSSQGEGVFRLYRVQWSPTNFHGGHSRHHWRSSWEPWIGSFLYQTHWENESIAILFLLWIA